ncbi:ABC transporter [Purpureocillium lavendulum]|uniref:ABC transporter n=1 Tax=Purpureocillium lavendulum TaxID=1247861 RepID=A0AB34G201_9HYPO|nr:ABC transporter [Purpureocillium lavendulum]
MNFSLRDRHPSWQGDNHGNDAADESCEPASRSDLFPKIQALRQILTHLERKANNDEIVHGARLIGDEHREPSKEDTTPKHGKTLSWAQDLAQVIEEEAENTDINGRPEQWPNYGEYRKDCLHYLGNDFQTSEEVEYWWDILQDTIENHKPASSAIDILMEEPKISIDSWKYPRTSMAVPDAQPPTLQPIQNEHRPLPERIRIHSHEVITILGRTHHSSLAATVQGVQSLVLLRPYRILCHYDSEIRDAYARLAQGQHHEETITHGPNNGGLQDEPTFPKSITITECREESSSRGESNTACEVPVDNGPTSQSGSDTAVKHLSCLLEFMDTYLSPRRSYLNSFICDRIFFSDLWHLFRPGDVVISADGKQAYRVIRVTPPSRRGTHNWSLYYERHKDDQEEQKLRAKSDLVIECVYIHYDGRKLGPVVQTFRINRFGGERSVTSLAIYPLRFYVSASTRVERQSNESESKKLATEALLDQKRKQLIERGRTFVEVAGVKHMYYAGLAIDTRDEIESQVVIDFEEAFAARAENYWRPEVTTLIGFADSMEEDEDKEGCEADCCWGENIHDDGYVEKERCKKFTDDLMAELGANTHRLPSVAIYPRSLEEAKTAANELKDEELLIMSHIVFGFVLRDRTWAQLDLSHLKPIESCSRRIDDANSDDDGSDEDLEDKSAFGRLVLPTGHKKMVMSLIAQHFRNKGGRDEQTDIVRGKGDLGTNAKEVETALQRNFTLASQWQCILLLDEADVFLAERRREDFTRNGLVAVFLRVLEYYSGVLFLTTNRIGDFDEAFASRIHMSLYYPPLSSTSTIKVFTLNLNIIRERYEASGRRIKIEEAEIIDNAGVYFRENAWARWNGRQIRNACQTALALAEFDAQPAGKKYDLETNSKARVTLKASHLQLVSAAYLEFTQYLKRQALRKFPSSAHEQLFAFRPAYRGRAETAVTPRPHAVVEEIPRPTPGPGEVLIRVHAVALNPVDEIYVSHPIATQEKRVVGTDFAGIVEGVSADLASSSDPRAKPGTRVAGFLQGACSTNDRPGAFAEYIVAPHDLIWQMPASLSFEAASAVSMCGLTAAQGLFPRLGLPSPFGNDPSGAPVTGESREPLNVFLYGSSTSLALYAAQLVHLSASASGRRIRLIGAASASKHEFLRAKPYSYDFLVDYRDPDWVDKVRQATGGRGADVAMDCISEQTTIYKTSEVLHPSGKLSVFRGPGGGKYDPEKARVKPTYGAVWEGLGVEIGYNGMSYPDLRDALAREFATRFFSFLSSQARDDKVKLEPNPVRAMPGGLERIVPDGFALLGSGSVSGRTALKREEAYMKPISAEKLGKNRRGGGGGGRGGASQNGGWRDFGVINKENERLQEYYNTLLKLPEEESQQFWDALKRELPNSFRFCGSKGHALAVKRLLQTRYIPEIVKIEHQDGRPVEPPRPVPWYPDELAWWMTTPKNVVRKFPPFAAFQKFLVSETSVGNISRQEVVSMIPPLLMDLRPGMTVLDMCAAPGSKSAQLVEMLHRGEEARVRKVLRSFAKEDGLDLGEETQEEIEADLEADPSDNGRATGLLIANDSDYKRGHMLVHQLKRLSSPNLLVTNHDATQFPSIRLPSKEATPTTPRYLKFDRILADVPCSGDGTMRKNANLWKDWNPGNALGLHQTQIRILVRALQLLKVGGRVVYSTCSMNPVENESVVASAIERCGGADNIEIVDNSEQLQGLERIPGMRNWKIMDKSGRMWDSWEEVEKFAQEENEGVIPGRVVQTMFPKVEGSDCHDLPLERCMRVYPHLQDTGGFFITVLEKKTDFKAKNENEPKQASSNQTSKANGAEKPAAPVETEEKKTDPEEPAAKVEAAVEGEVPANGGKRALEETDDAEQQAAKKAKTEESSAAATPVAQPEQQKQQQQQQQQQSEVISKPKKQGPPEEPFKYLNPSHEVIQAIKKFYSISTRFPDNRYMVRNELGEPAKAIYYTTALTRDILTENEGRGVRFVHGGVRMFMKQDAPSAEVCRWRIQAEGMPILQGYVGEPRVIHLRNKETLRRLLIEMFPRISGDEWRAFDEIGEQVRDVGMGCCVLRVEPDGTDPDFSERMALPLWKSIHSLNLMLPKEDRSAMLLRIFNDTSPLINPALQKNKDNNNNNNNGGGGQAEKVEEEEEAAPAEANDVDLEDLPTPEPMNEDGAAATTEDAPAEPAEA